MRIDSRTHPRDPSILTDADFGAIGAALDAFQQAAGEAAADPCQRSPQCIVTRYVRDTPGLCAGLAALLDAPATREGEDGPAALLVAFLWLLMEGQALSPLGQRFLMAALLWLDHDALLAELAEGGGNAA